MMVMMTPVIHRQPQPTNHTQGDEDIGHIEVSHGYSFWLEYTPQSIEWKAIWRIYYPKDRLKDRVKAYGKYRAGNFLGGRHAGVAGGNRFPARFSAATCGEPKNGS